MATNQILENVLRTEIEKTIYCSDLVIHLGCREIDLIFLYFLNVLSGRPV